MREYCTIVCQIAITYAINNTSKSNLVQSGYIAIHSDNY